MSNLKTKKDLSLKKIVELKIEDEDIISENLNNISQGPSIDDEQLFKMKDKLEQKPIEQKPIEQKPIEQKPIEQPIVKKKKQRRKPLSEKHKEALRKGRLKALENRRRKAKARREKIIKNKALKENIAENKLRHRIDRAYEINNRQAFSNVKDFFSMMEQYERYKASKIPQHKPTKIIKEEPKPKEVNPYDHYFS
tara:strand:+ start:268 stop:852 length:585 start_codon:yes stop_codon:yes gene_type:complete